MASFYPRKQTVFIFVTCLAIVVGTAFYANPFGAKDSSSQTIAVTGTGDTQNNAVEQIDSPSLSNWKEAFASSSKGQAVAAKSPENLTQTDKFGRDFFTQYIVLKQANMLNNQTVVNQAAEDLVTSNIDANPQKVYTEKDLHIITGSDAATLNAYSAAVARVMDSYSITKNESAIIQEYLSTEDPKVLKGIDPIIATYKRMIFALLSIPTPAVVSAEQLKLVNAFETFKFAAEALRVSDTDTVRSLSGVSAHVNAAGATIEALTDIHNSLLNLGVTFDFRQEILNVLLS